MLVLLMTGKATYTPSPSRNSWTIGIEVLFSPFSNSLSVVTHHFCCCRVEWFIQPPYRRPRHPSRLRSQLRLKWKLQGTYTCDPRTHHPPPTPLVELHRICCHHRRRQAIYKNGRCRSNFGYIFEYFSCNFHHNCPGESAGILC